jgi:hypothetical protein
MEWRIGMKVTVCYDGRPQLIDTIQDIGGGRIRLTPGSFYDMAGMAEKGHPPDPNYYRWTIRPTSAQDIKRLEYLDFLEEFQNWYLLPLETLEQVVQIIKSTKISDNLPEDSKGAM